MIFIQLRFSNYFSTRGGPVVVVVVVVGVGIGIGIDDDGSCSLTVEVVVILESFVLVFELFFTRDGSESDAVVAVDVDPDDDGSCRVIEVVLESFVLFLREEALLVPLSLFLSLVLVLCFLVVSSALLLREVLSLLLLSLLLLLSPLLPLLLAATIFETPSRKK